MLCSVTVEEDYTFTVNSDTGKVTDTRRRIRDRVLCLGCTSVSRYELTVTCKDASGKTLVKQDPVSKWVNLNKGKKAWTSWIEIPVATASWHLNYSFVYKK